MAPSLVINILANATEAKHALKDVGKDVDELGQSTSNMGKVIAAGAAAGAVALIGLGVSAFNAAAESAKIGRETERVIKTTGAAAFISAQQVGDLATAISDKTGADDEAIQSGENLILTFTNVRNEVGQGNDVFDRATAAALDMSTAMGTDMSSASIQLGKALNDPIKGIAALAKAGVSFNAQQRDQIELMVKSGDLLGAQKVILGEVEKEFKGAAEAAGTPLDKLGVAVGNLQEDLGAKLIPAVDATASILLNALGPAVELVGGFLSENQHAVEALAAAVAVSLLPSLVSSAAAFVAMTAAPVLSFLSTGAVFARVLAAEFVATTTASEGLAVAMEALSLAGPAIAFTAIAAGAFALISAFDHSSESADKFFKKATERVDTSSFDSMHAAMRKVDDELAASRKHLAETSGSWRDTAAAVADILIPWHEVEDSTHQQANHIITLNQLHDDYNDKIREGEAGLFSYAEAHVAAAHGIEMQANADLALIGTQKELGVEINGLTDKLKAIAASKGIELTSPEAVDRVKALFEATQHASTSTLEMSEAQKKYNDAASTAKDKVDAYKQSLDALTGAHISAAAAETNYSQNSLSLLSTLSKNKSAVEGMTNAWDLNESSSLAQTAAINSNNKAIQDNVKSALDLANATFQEQQGTVGQTQALKNASDGLTVHREQLIAVMKQMGFSEQAAEDYINRLGLTPANINTQVNLDNHQANAAIDVTQGKLNVAAGVYTATVDANTQPAEQALKNLMAFFQQATNEAKSRALQGTGRSLSATAPAVTPLSSSPVFNVTVNSTGLGVDSPRLQRDLVKTLQRFAVREGPIRVPVTP